MNANELADDMEGGRFNDINYNKKKAADFVRQQQAEIEALTKELETCKTIVALSNIAWERKHGKD